MAFEVTKNTLIGDILDEDNTTAPYFMEMGMHCLGCPGSSGETVEEACMVHGVDTDAFLVELNNYLAECEKSKEEA